MFIEAKSLFTTEYSTFTQGKPGRPFINMPQIGFAMFANQSIIANKKTVMDFVKRSPEALGIIRAIAMDIVTKLNFKSIALQGKGRPFKELHQNKEDESKEFAKRHQVKQTLMAEVMDMLITGELFNWIGDDFTEKVKEITERVTAKTIKEKFPDVK